MMEMFVRCRIILIFLCFRLTSSEDSLNGKFQRFQLPEDIKTLCPFTSFCEQNASLSFMGTTDEMPCCQGCSCEPSCGLYSNCCFKHLDVYNIEERNKMICQSTIKEGKPSLRAPHFRMINECINSQESHKNQTKILSGYSPVYSAMTGSIYFNSEIASCNSVNDTIPFQKAIRCFYQNEYLDDAHRLLKGLEPKTTCKIYYIPPDGNDLESEQCKPALVSKCNVTGTVKEWQPYWTYCESFKAVFIIHLGFREYTYANIYCYMCNEQFQKHGFGEIIKKCSRRVDKFTGIDYSLTVILKPGFLLPDDNQNGVVRPSNTSCPSNHILIQSFTKSCRPIKCPVWKTIVRGKCEFYSARWIGARIAVTLRVTTISNKYQIPRAFFYELPQWDRNDPLARWLKRKTMKHWELTTYYHTSEDNTSIDFLIIQAKCKFVSVNPRYIEQTVKRTINDNWFIEYQNERIPLKVSINKGKSFVERFQIMFTKVYGLYEEVDLTQQMITKDILHSVSNGVWTPLVESMLITNMFFCPQIDLYPDEFEDKVNTIFFKVKKTTIYDFTRLKISVKNKTTIENKVDKDLVRVCLREFADTWNVGNSNRITSTNLRVSHQTMYIWRSCFTIFVIFY